LPIFNSKFSIFVLVGVGEYVGKAGVNVTDILAVGV
jgi:hypothetical protein